jgi:hypothetical protein
MLKKFKAFGRGEHSDNRSVVSSCIKPNAAADKSNKKLRYKNKEKRFRLFVRRLVKHQLFYWIVIVLVFLNALCIGVEHNNQPQWLSDFLCKLFK